MSKHTAGNFVGKFIRDFLNDVQKSHVQSAIDRAQKRRLPTPVLDKMKSIEDEVEDLKKFLDRYE